MSLYWAGLLEYTLPFSLSRSTHQSMVSYLSRGDDSDWYICHWHHEQVSCTLPHNFLPSLLCCSIARGQKIPIFSAAGLPHNDVRELIHWNYSLLLLSVDCCSDLSPRRIGEAGSQQGSRGWSWRQLCYRVCCYGCTYIVTLHIVSSLLFLSLGQYGDC